MTFNGPDQINDTTRICKLLSDGVADIADKGESIIPPETYPTEGVPIRVWARNQLNVEIHKRSTIYWLNKANVKVEFT
jgi:hypothetical protein